MGVVGVEGTVPAGFECKGTKLEGADVHGMLDELSLIGFRGRHDELWQEESWTAG